MIRLILALAVLVVLSVFVIPFVLVKTATPVEVVYAVPFALCIAIMIRRLTGTEARRGDERAAKFGEWAAKRIAEKFGLQPRPEPTKPERIIAAAVGTAVVGLLVIAVYFTQAGDRWYGVIFGLWLVAMFTSWAVRRPSLQSRNESE
ncbi:hypothetical protein IFT59_07610 [Rhizobium sp. CFBP 8752]|uniref:hypothetical protein n=1 Tax=Rhizobium sp. CFBP 8752 TaxID=2775301 RepID=UPI001784D055|nr:hypothetical protein [Rhizobium sp. CFBP 8752]MBD8663118.1 hypothetical protein [Rhizobium sp. CFBP 8752]